MVEISKSFRILAIAQKFPSFFSVIGASMIVSSVLRSKKNRQKVQQRLVCAMSFVDLIVSIVWVATNLLMHKENQTYPWTIGNDASCKAQGALVQFSIASVVYNACLSVYYLFIIKFNWKENQTRGMEKFFHIISLAFGLGTSSTVLALDLYHPADWDCWIAPTPEGEKADLVNILRWCFFFGPLWVSIVISLSVMVVLYLHVNNIEKEIGSKSSDNKDKGKNKMEKTKSVAAQGRLYIIAFLVTWMFPTIARILQLLGLGVPMWIVVAAGTIIPSNGFFNAIVYFRVRFQRLVKANPEKSQLWAFGEIMRINLFFWICPGDGNDDGDMVAGATTTAVDLRTSTVHPA